MKIQLLVAFAALSACLCGAKDRWSPVRIEKRPGELAVTVNGTAAGAVAAVL